MLKRLLHQPAGLVFARAWVKLFGNVRQKEEFGALERPQYAYGLLRAAEMARSAGKRRATVCEFGVAAGAGLLNMIALTESIGRATDVEFRVVGFDSGKGLIRIDGYKDHPELWSPGDFPMGNSEDLVARIGSRAELFLGDIEDTVDEFLATMDPDCPLGFVAIDVDVYSATKSALRCLTKPPEFYGPAVSMYFDDVAFFFANRWCGELAAIEEFNSASFHRKIDIDRGLPGSRPVRDANWYRHMYACHILDHPLRTRPQRTASMNLQEHAAQMRRTR